MYRHTETSLNQTYLIIDAEYEIQFKREESDFRELKFVGIIAYLTFFLVCRLENTLEALCMDLMLKQA